MTPHWYFHSLKKGIATLKKQKAAGIDDVLVEQLKNLGPRAHRWLHSMLNVCFTENRIPKVWRHSKLIAILKPGKDSAKPKSYRLISLLYHIYKLYERLILNRIAPTVDRHLIKEQVGFRPGKSCCSQLLNLTDHIEVGYQRGMITGAAFVDRSAAHDTVNHRLLIRKLYDFTKDIPLCRVFQNMLSRFYVELNNDRSRWRNQKNGLPRVVYYLQYCLTHTQTTNHFTMEPGTLSMQMIYVSQPNIHPSLR